MLRDTTYNRINYYFPFSSSNGGEVVEPMPPTSTLAMWIKAQDADTTVNDALVTQVENKGYVKGLLTQTSATSKPKYLTLGHNNKPALVFDGVNDFMRIDSEISFIPRMVIIVCASTKSSPNFSSTDGLFCNPSPGTYYFTGNDGLTTMDLQGGSSCHINGIIGNNDFAPLVETKIVGYVIPSAVLASQHLFGLGEDRGVAGRYWKGPIQEALVYSDYDLDKFNEAIAYIQQKYAF